MDFNIIYIKVPKTGSSSIRDSLINYCDDNDIEYVNKSAKSILNHKDEIGASLGHIPHQPKFINHINSILIDDLKTLTIGSVREPLSRFLSNFRYNGGKGDFNKQYEKMNLQKVWNSNHDNLMSTYLGFDTLESITTDSIKSRFDHIIVLENYNESLKKLSNLLNYELKPLISNIGTGGKLDISDDTLLLFKKRNEIDYKLYELCREIYG